MSAPLAQQQEIAEWRAQYSGLVAAIEDVNNGYVALIGSWSEVPAALEQTGGIFGQGEVTDHLYVLTHTGYLPERLLTTLLPPPRYQRRAFELICRESLRRLAQSPDRTKDQQQLEGLLADSLAQIQSAQ